MISHGDRAIANTCNDIGRLLTELGRNQEARPWLDRALKIAERIGADEIIRDAHWHLSRQAVASGDFRRAVSELEAFSEVKDRFLDVDRQTIAGCKRTDPAHPISGTAFCRGRVMPRRLGANR